MADVSRSDVSTLIEEAYASTLLDSAFTESVALQTFRRVDMGTKVTNLPVLATVPTAEFVAEAASGDDGVKPTSEATWGNKVLTAEEIAVIIPVHENVVDDATEDVLGQIATQGGAAIGRALDAAVMFGTNKPVSWTSADLHAAAVAASQTFTVGTIEEDLIGSIFMAAESVEEAGWDPSDVIARRGLRFRLANLRASATDGTPIFLPSMGNNPGAGDTIGGLTGRWASSRVWDPDVEALVVDAERVIIGVRQDVSVKFLSEATVGGINLAERDMVALRFKARFAYVLGDNTNANSNSANCPVGAVLAAGS